MHDTWRGLGLLLVVPWLAACVSGPPVRLETGQGAPIVYRPPADEPPPVRVSQEEFVSALTDLMLLTPLSLELPERRGRVVRASWSASMGDPAQAWMERQCAPSEPPDGCLVLPSNAPPPETLARLRLALSFAMDTVWEGAAVPVSEYMDPLAFKVMVYTALCTYLVLLLVPVPEPVTKGVAAVLTLYLVAYLGLGPMRELVRAGDRLLEESARATTTGELRAAGQRFGRVLGDSGMRVLLLMATAALGGKGSMVGKGPKLPGFGKAALLSPVRTGVRLEAAGQVGSVVLGAEELVVVLAPTAVAANAMGPGGSLPTDQNAEAGASNGSSPPQGLLDSQAKHITKIDNIIRDHAKPSDFEGVAKEFAGQRIPKSGGGYWDHRREMTQSVRDLKRHVRALEGSLGNPAHSPAVRSYVQDAINKARAMISRMEEALSGGG